MNERVGHRLMLAIEAAELTPDVVAARASVKPQLMADVLAGRREAPMAFLMRVARVLDLTPEYLRTGEGATGLDARPGFRRLRAKLEQLPTPQQDELCAIFCRAFEVADGRRTTPKEPT